MASVSIIKSSKTSNMAITFNDQNEPRIDITHTFSDWLFIFPQSSKLFITFLSINESLSFKAFKCSQDSQYHIEMKLTSVNEESETNCKFNVDM